MKMLPRPCVYQFRLVEQAMGHRFGASWKQEAGCGEERGHSATTTCLKEGILWINKVKKDYGGDVAFFAV